MSQYPALATVEDIEGSDSFTPAQLASAHDTLERASTVVRAYCARAFTLDSFTTRIRARGPWLYLPQKPVVSVESVKIIVFGTPLITVGWLWDGMDRVWLGNLGIVENLSEELLQVARYGVEVAEVAYTAGYTTVPDEIVTVVASVAGRALLMPVGGVVTQQAVGPFSYSIATWAKGGPLSLADAEKSILAPFRRSTGTWEMRS